MRVIFISTDKKILEPDSAVVRRFEDYKKLFDEVQVVVLNRNIFSAYKTAKNLIETRLNDKVGQDSKLKIENCIVSTQDPFETGIIGVLLKLKFGLPLQIQLHTDFNNKYFLLSTPLNFVRFFLAHLILPFADSVRVVSERVKKNIGELGKNVSVLPISQEEALKHLVPKTSPWKKTQEKITILIVARLEKEKDIGTAIKVFAQISKKYPIAEFVIVGEGRQRKNLEKLSKDLNVFDKVKFVGWQNDVVGFFENSHIYISTSLFEGYGMSLVEAASTKIPLVLSDAGIAGDVFKNNESAFICPPKNVECFVSALRKLLDDENLRIQMGESSYATAMASVLSKEAYLIRFKELIDTTPKSDLGESSFARMCQFVALIIERNRVLRFILAGGTSALSQITVLYVFTDLLGIWYLYSSILSFIIALFISFTLQKFWAFKDRTMNDAHIQFFKYTIIIFIGLILNTSMMYFLVDILNIWYILSQIITGAFIAVVNFLSYKKFIFNK